MKRHLLLSLFIFFFASIWSQTNLSENSNFKLASELFIDKKYDDLKSLVKTQFSSEKFPNEFYVIAAKIIRDIDSSFLNELTLHQREVIEFVDEIDKASDAENGALVYDKLKNCNFLNELPNETYYRIISLVDDISFDETKRLIKNDLVVNGDNFRSAWNLLFISGSGRRVGLFSEIKIDSFFDDYPAFKNFATEMIDEVAYIETNWTLKWNNYVVISAIENFLKVYPDDAMALRCMANNLSELGRVSEAKKYHLNSYQNNPFYSDGIAKMDVVRIQFKFYHEEDAEAKLTEYWKVHFPNLETQALLKAQILNSVEHFTESDSILQTYLAEKPTESKALRLMADIQFYAENYQKALGLYSKIPTAIIGQDLNLYNNYLKSLVKTESFEDFLIELNRFEASDISFNPYISYTFYSYLWDSGEKERALKIIEKTLSKYPESNWLIKNYSFYNQELKNYEIAETNYLKAMQIQPTDSWIVKRLVSLYPLLGKNSSEELQKLFELYPYSNAVIHELAKAKKIDDKISFYKSLERSPKRIVAFEIAFELYSNKEYDKEEDFYFSQLGSAESDLDSMFYLNLLVLSGLEIEREEHTVSELKKYEQIADAYNKQNGDLKSYHKLKAYIYRSLGDKEKMSVEVEKMIKYYPQDYALMVTGIVDFQDRTTAYTFMRKLIEKNKFNYQLQTEYIKRNNTYPGSRINAIWAYNSCKSAFPNKDCSSANYNGALAFFGDCKSEMNDYKNVTNLGTTNRYINWYNNARQKMFRNQNEVIFDFDKSIVKVLNENGEELLYSDDKYTGKPILRQKGKVWIKYNYNDRGDLTSVHTSGAATILLEYDGNFKVSKLVSSKNGTIIFEYNDFGKPSKMILEKGILNVEYDLETHEISKVVSIPEDIGSVLSLEVSEIMRELTAIVREDAINEVAIEGTDEFIKLKDKYEEFYNSNAKLSAKALSAIEDYVLFMKDNISGEGSFSTSILNISFDVLHQLNPTTKLKQKEQILNFADYYYTVLKDIRRQGIASDYWSQWNQILLLLEKEKQSQLTLNNYRKKIETLQTKFSENPIKLLKSSEWLPKSDLKNEAFWLATKLDEIYETEKPRSVLKRSNGDVLLVYSSGLAIKERGFWKYLYYDGINKKLLQDKDLIKLSSSTVFYNITEDESGVLILNTSKGLYQLENDYYTLNELSGSNTIALDGFSEILSIDSINFIQYNSNTINLIQKSATNVQLSYSLKIPAIKKVSFDSNIGFLVLTENEIKQLSYDKTSITQLSKSITQSKYKILDFKQLGDNLYYIANNRLFIYQISTGFSREFPDNIIFNKEIYGLSMIPIKQDLELSVITDLGLNIFREQHFENLNFEAKGSFDELTPQYYFNQENFGILSKNYLIEFSKQDYTYSKDETQKIILDTVHRHTLRHLSWGITYESDSLTDIVTESYVDQFDLDANSAVIYNNYNSIYRAEYDSLEKRYKSEFLFDFEPYQHESFSNSKVKKIEVSNDGTIWVMTNLSVFRYNPEKWNAVKEFCYYVDKIEFPAKTLEVFNLIETYDGEILVVNSDESWNDYKGVALNGGLLIYNWEKGVFEYFDPQNAAPEFPWFITSYTQISNNEAILGTTAGFAYHSNGGIKLFSKMENESYNDILKEHKNLFLGTNGVKFGDFYLFGCAEGIVAYRDKIWFYPDRLNQLLPEFQSFGLWGGNKVNSLAIDQAGRLNIATDLGSLTINSSKLDPYDLLLMNKISNNDIIRYHDSQRLHSEKDLLISELPQKSSVRKVIDEVRSLESTIEDLNKLKNSFTENFRLKTHVQKTINIDSVDYQIKRIGKEHSSLLLSIKESNPILYQTLQVPPLELAGLRNNLKDDECIVQYIPLQERLLIQLVSKERTILKEVTISKNELYNQAYLASYLLSGNESIRGEIVVNLISKSDSTNALKNVSQQLYNSLLAPICVDLEKFKGKIQIIAEGGLNYIPFEALMYKDGTNKLHYAIEKYNFTYLSSLSMMQFLIESKAKLTNSNPYLFIGDPDGSLKYAKSEVQEIASICNRANKLMVGREATLNAFRKESGGKDIIHLSTHGFVDRNTIKDSYILFADAKLSMAEVYELNLDATNLVVLSACETGLGKDGLETTTLSRAFANAGVENLIASLWTVNDESTKILMVEFYKELQLKRDFTEALRNAKLKLIEYEDGKFKHPTYWAAFVFLGKVD